MSSRIDDVATYFAAAMLVGPIRAGGCPHDASLDRAIELAIELREKVDSLVAAQDVQEVNPERAVDTRRNVKDSKPAGTKDGEPLKVSG